MTSEEVAAYKARQAEGYYRQQVELGGFTEQAARARTEESMRRFWSDARPPAGHHLFTAEASGRTVGWLWFSETSDVPGEAWIFDVEVAADVRGRGYGRAIMREALVKVRAMGCVKLGLNVFGSNDVAINLYRSMGFRTQSMQMTIEL
jgi:ribosomal protein S18 acetylase RimI-like enzyme